MIDLKSKIMNEAIDSCLREMYRCSQPSADYDKLKEYAKEHPEEEKEFPTFKRYYLSTEQFKYILKKYAEAYHLIPGWKNNIETIKDEFETGSDKKEYKKDSYGEMFIERVPTPPLCERIGQENTKKVLEMLDEIDDSHKRDKDARYFYSSLSLGHSPTSNLKDVKEFWKDKGLELEFEERHCDEDVFFDMDMYEATSIKELEEHLIGPND
jgi:hypothetical protein